jgi:hypothetical protein
MGKPDVVEAPTRPGAADVYYLYPKSTALNNIPLGLISFTLTWWMPDFFPDERPNVYRLYYVDGRLSNWQ